MTVHRRTLTIDADYRAQVATITIEPSIRRIDGAVVATKACVIRVARLEGNPQDDGPRPPNFAVTYSEQIQVTNLPGFEPAFLAALQIAAGAAAGELAGLAGRPAVSDGSERVPAPQVYRGRTIEVAERSTGSWCYRISGPFFHMWSLPQGSEEEAWVAARRQVDWDAD